MSRRKDRLEMELRLQGGGLLTIKKMLEDLPVCQEAGCPGVEETCLRNASRSTCMPRSRVSSNRRNMLKKCFNIYLYAKKQGVQE
jgi:hypothetical protein